MHPCNWAESEQSRRTAGQILLADIVVIGCSYILGTLAPAALPARKKIQEVLQAVGARGANTDVFLQPAAAIEREAVEGSITWR